MCSTAVESTTLATVAYDEHRHLLRLEFRSRAIYQYSGVPAAVHEALLRAPSKGSYFNQFIRGRFPYCLTGTGQAGVQQRVLAPGTRGKGHGTNLGKAARGQPDH